MQEIWKPIKDYEGLYEVSNLGRVKSLSKKQRVNIKNNNLITKREKILKLRNDKYGYVRCMLYGKEKPVLKQVHRLVAEAFLKNYSNELEVNHKDCNVTNNCVFNLEMCTRKQNMEYASKLKRFNPKKRQVLQCDKNNVILNKYESITDASIAVGTSVANLSKSLRNNDKTAKGYKWRYVDE